MADAKGEGQKVTVTLTAPAGAATPSKVHFFPFKEGHVEPAGKQTFAREANGTFVLTLPVANQLLPGFVEVAGVLTADNGFASGADKRARDHHRGTPPGRGGRGTQAGVVRRRGARARHERSSRSRRAARFRLRRRSSSPSSAASS